MVLRLSDDSKGDKLIKMKKSERNISLQTSFVLYLRAEAVDRRPVNWNMRSTEKAGVDDRKSTNPQMWSTDPPKLTNFPETRPTSTASTSKSRPA